jgi:hypothetical protein
MCFAGREYFTCSFLVALLVLVHFIESARRPSHIQSLCLYPFLRRSPSLALLRAAHVRNPLPLHNYISGSLSKYCSCLFQTPVEIDWHGAELISSE